jgi:hypothetical protein
MLLEHRGLTEGVIWLTIEVYRAVKLELLASFMPVAVARHSASRHSVPVSGRCPGDGQAQGDPAGFRAEEQPAELLRGLPGFLTEGS